MAAAAYAGGNTNYPVDQWVQSAVSAATGIVAKAGGGQATATLLTATSNSVDTVATAADSVALPLATVGALVFVANTSANSLQVFGSGTDTINAAATGTGVAVATLKNAAFFCVSAAPAGKWRMILSA